MLQPRRMFRDTMTQAGPRAHMRECACLCSCVGRMKQAPRSSRCWLRKLHLVSALGGKKRQGMEQRLSQPGCGPRKEINAPPMLFVFIVFVCACIPLLVQMHGNSALQMDVVYLGNCLWTWAFKPEHIGQDCW